MNSSYDDNVSSGIMESHSQFDNSKRENAIASSPNFPSALRKFPEENSAVQGEAVTSISNVTRIKLETGHQRNRLDDLCAESFEIDNAQQVSVYNSHKTSSIANEKAEHLLNLIILGENDTISEFEIKISPVENSKSSSCCEENLILEKDAEEQHKELDGRGSLFETDFEKLASGSRNSNVGQALCRNTIDGEKADKIALETVPNYNDETVVIDFANLDIAGKGASSNTMDHVPQNAGCGDKLSADEVPKLDIENTSVLCCSVEKRPSESFSNSINELRKNDEKITGVNYFEPIFNTDEALSDEMLTVNNHNITSPLDNRISIASSDFIANPSGEPTENNVSENAVNTGEETANAERALIEKLAELEDKNIALPMSDTIGEISPKMLTDAMDDSSESSANSGVTNSVQEASVINELSSVEVSKLTKFNDAPFSNDATNQTVSETGSKSMNEESVLCTSKPILSDFEKSVKFTMPTKSMNIIQSNAQFLNKSRNFLNFITEKSTNIMEKTLLPQNITATYNTILRLTDKHESDKKCIEGTSTCSETALISHSSSNLSFDHSKGNENMCATVNDPEKTTDRVKFPERKKSLQESANCIFLKCSANETNINQIVAETIPTLESNMVPDTFSDVNLANYEANYDSGNVDKADDDIPGIPCLKDDRIHRNEFELITKDNPKLLTETVVQTFVDESKDIEQHVMDRSKKFDYIPSVECSNNNNSHTSLANDVVEKNVKSKSESDVTVRKTNSTIDKIEVLDSPAYVALLRDYTKLKEQNVKLQDTVKELNEQNLKLLADSGKEAFALQIKMLERTVENLKYDLKQMGTAQEALNKEYVSANKEKESMVMKYAISEKQLIDTQRAREYAERKIKESAREQELLQNKLKQVQGERTRICNILDGKCHELTDALKEVERLKEELNVRDVKLKWAQNQLKTETDAQKETQQKLEKATMRINEMREECELVRKESEETIRKFRLSEENKAVSLDQQLKEQQARLILERHVIEDKEISRIQLQKEVDVLKQRQIVLIEENNTLSLKVQNLEKEHLDYERNLSSLKVIADQRQKEIVDLVGKVSQLETIKLQLNHKEQLLGSNEAEVERLRQSNKELQADMEWCREREAHMLDFTQKLTDKNVRLQSEFTTVEAKAQQLEQEQGPLHESIKELSLKIKQLEMNLLSEKSKRTEECELLARHVAEQTQLARNLTQQLEDSNSENAVLRKKQQISVKEMSKELQQCRKRLEMFETASPANSLNPPSRTASSTSLNTAETLNGGLSDNNSSDHAIQIAEPDRQSLINRIVKLQKIRAKQAEKLDFLEEHTATLVNELQKKTKIIKNYILRENSDAMGSDERDRNKAELARHGGIMASVYNQRVSDDNMTLELSLEINQKLQAVLEDTLLKNITLKDSIDTLGGEIARLTMQSKQQQ